jgi:hypothetical protein
MTTRQYAQGEYEEPTSAGHFRPALVYSWVIAADWLEFLPEAFEIRRFNK